MYLHLRRTLRLRVQKWGNSLALRIPAAFARETGIGSGAEVDLTLDDGRLIITPSSIGLWSIKCFDSKTLCQKSSDGWNLSSPRIPNALTIRPRYISVTVFTFTL